MEEGEKAEEKCEEWEEIVDAWDALSDEERRRNKDQEPNWEEKPTEQEVSYFQFFQAVKRAEAEAEAAAVLHIKKAASEGTWQAAAWYLERKYKDRWSRQDSLKHEGSVAHDHAHQHQLLSTSPEAIEAAKERLRAVRALSEGSQAPELPQSEQVIEAEIIPDDDLEAEELPKNTTPHNQADSEE